MTKTTDFWSEDDQPRAQPVRRWRWWHVASLVAVLVFALFAVVGVLMPEKVAGGWLDLQVRQLRQEILSGGLSSEALRDELRRREGGHHLAIRLSQDADPRVRAAVVETIASWGTRAGKRSPDDPFITRNTLSSDEDAEALKRLITDPDATVRQTALRAVCSLEEVRGFREQILSILGNGSVEERAIIAESLAHWNGEALVNTFSDPSQPKEVRLAALKGIDRYGWREVLPDGERMTLALIQAERDADPQLSPSAAEKLAQLRRLREK